MATIGDRVGPYEVLERLGHRGGMAIVYLARHERLGRLAALKELDFRADDPSLADRFFEPGWVRRRL